MTSTPDERDTLAAIDGVLARGGDADEVLRGVLDSLHEQGIPYAALRFIENGALVDGPTVGAPVDAVEVPVLYEGARVGELALATNDPAFAERVAALISPYVLVGWDTAGEPWAP